jgi:23S rRNA (uracil1939-C5)-methyltransferase
MANLKIMDRGSCAHRQGVAEAQTEFPSGHFSQVNEEGNAELRAAVVERVSNREVLELYAGAGNFSLALAQRGHTVTAVEADAELVRYGKREALSHGLAESLNFQHSSCEKFMKSAHVLPKTLLLDPPRGGAKAALERIAARGVEEVVYVSCNLPTLARDLGLLAAQGFEVQEVLVIDMFAQTHHVETVSTAVMARAPEEKESA